MKQPTLSPLLQIRTQNLYHKKKSYHTNSKETTTMTSNNSDLEDVIGNKYMKEINKSKPKKDIYSF